MYVKLVHNFFPNQTTCGQDDLPHPPLTNVGNEYAWRSADGSGNNIANPSLGAAGNPYARSVSQFNPLPRHQLPDPGLVFGTLLRRENVCNSFCYLWMNALTTVAIAIQLVPHPAGLSSLMFSFAALVAHSYVTIVFSYRIPHSHRIKITLTNPFVFSVFRTAHDNVNINETSSYVDLAPLYGVNHEKLYRVRMLDGRGLMHPDVFSEDRLLLLPLPFASSWFCSTAITMYASPRPQYGIPGIFPADRM